MPHPAINSVKMRQRLAAAVASSNDAAASLRARIVPLQESGQPAQSQAVEVKNYDHRGIKFQHEQPLHARRALVVLEGSSLGRLAAEVDLSWCRFTRAGEYTSGGRFVQLVGQSA
ncbi:MAG: hypothetical protein MI725_11585 [Pirellulales bacterium]|nr:hypothetical protein [Pirellulales bacterium]